MDDMDPPHKRCAMIGDECRAIYVCDEWSRSLGESNVPGLKFCGFRLYELQRFSPLNKRRIESRIAIDNPRLMYRLARSFAYPASSFQEFTEER
jgi:hypothetical protein